MLRPDHEPGSFLGKRVYTDDGKVQLAPPELLARLKKLIEGGDLEKASDHAPGSYKLITRRSVTTHNSWTHNYTPFLQREDNRNYLYMHSADMAAEGFAEHDLIRISSGVDGSKKVKPSSVKFQISPWYSPKKSYSPPLKSTENHISSPKTPSSASRP